MPEGSDSIDRIKAAIATALLEALLAYALFAGFWRPPPNAEADPLKRFAILAEAAPPVVSVPPVERSTKPEGAASPPNLKSRATEIVAPPPLVRPIVPPPVVAAPTPALGSDWSSGAADVRGPGTGSGGIGTGTGSGDGGLGEGGGRRTGSPPRKLRGRLNDSDYPRSAGEAGVGGEVSVIFAVETNGRVTNCEVTESSGYAALDENTCRLIMRRYRFEPAKDWQGRPVRSRVTENHSWIIEQEILPE
jgi:periplasmic protein TonB